VSDSQSSINIPAEFTAAHRLLREDGFDHVVRAENITDRHFRISFVRNGRKNARLGIIAGKRTLPGAVQRNRVKRAIREQFRQHRIKARQIDLVVIVRCADSTAAISEELKKLFSRVEDRCANL
jgi:ribonuclease P protein component